MEVFFFFLVILSILIITRVFRGYLLNKLLEDTDLTLDSVVLGDNSL